MEGEHGHFHTFLGVGATRARLAREEAGAGAEYAQPPWGRVSVGADAVGREPVPEFREADSKPAHSHRS